LNQARFRRALTKVENALRQDSVVYISLVMTRKNIANMLHFFAYLKPSQDINNIQKMYLTLHKFLHHYVLVACVSTSDPGLWALGWLCKKSPETVQAQIVSFNAALNYVRPPTVSELIYRDKSLPPLEQSSPSNIYRNEKSQDYFLLQKEVAYYQDEILLDDPVVDQALDNRQLNTQEDSIQREEEDQDRVPQIKLDEKDYENIISMNKEEDNFNLEILEAETVNQTKLQFMIHQIRNLENERIRTKQKNVEIVQQFSDQLYKLKFAKIAADVAANAAVDLLGKSQQESHAALKLLENRVIHLERALKLAQDQAVNSEALLTHRLLLAESQNKLATATVERIRTAAANELECTLSEIRASVAGQAQAAHRALKTLADERDKLAQARISDQEELQAALTKLRQFEEREEKCLLENSEKKKKPNTEEEEKEEAQQANFKDKTTELLENNLREKQCELDELRASSRREAAALWLAVGKTEFYLNQQGEQEQQRNDEIIHKTPPQERAAVQTIIAPSADELTLTAELSSLDQKLAGLRNNNVHKNDDGIKRPLQSSKILGPRQTVERVEKTNKEVLNFLELSSESPQILSPSRILRKIEVEEGGVHHSFSDDDHPSPTDSYHQFSYSLSQLQDKHSPSSKQQQSNTNTRHSTSDVTPAYYGQRHQFDNSSSARVTKYTPTAKTLLDPITVHSFPSTLRSGLDSPGSVAVRTNNTFSSSYNRRMMRKKSSLPFPQHSSLSTPPAPVSSSSHTMTAATTTTRRK